MPPNLTSDGHCRACNGRGGKWEMEDRNGRQAQVWESCFDCDGTGRQTVLVGQR